MIRKNGVAWFDNGPLPVYFGVSLSQKSFDKEMKRMGLKDMGHFSLGRSAATHRFEKDGEMDTIIITIDKKIFFICMNFIVNVSIFVVAKLKIILKKC